MELDRVVKNKKHQPPHHLGQVAVVDVHGVQKKPAKTLTFSAEMCTSVHMPARHSRYSGRAECEMTACIGTNQLSGDLRHIHSTGQPAYHRLSRPAVTAHQSSTQH